MFAFSRKRVRAEAFAKAFANDLDPDDAVDLDADGLLTLSAAPASSSSRINLDEENVTPTVAAIASEGSAPSGQECSVDGDCVQAPDRAAGKYYMFTVVTERGEAQYKKPDDIGREGLFTAVTNVYGEAYPQAKHGRQNRTMQDRIGQNRTVQDRTKPDRTGQRT